jgi:hypothetical protein
VLGGLGNKVAYFALAAARVRHRPPDMKRVLPVSAWLRALACPTAAFAVPPQLYEGNPFA